MNLEKLKQNKGWRMRLAPSATHFNRNGKALPETDEDWIVQSVTDQVVELTSVSGIQYQLLLGTDHIVSFYTDPPRDIDGLKHGILQLKVHVHIKDGRITLHPNARPGERVEPPPAYETGHVALTGISADARRQLMVGIKAFHMERTTLIAINDSGIETLGGATLVTHLFPASAEAGSPANFDQLAAQPNLFPPMGDKRPRDSQIDFDGLLTGSNLEGLGKPQRAHVRVFRTGIVESVVSSLAERRDSHSLILPHLQALIIKYSFLYVRALASVGIASPYYIACSLVGVQNTRLLQDFIPSGAYPEDLPQARLRQSRYDFTEAVVNELPETINDCAKQIRNLLDHAANAAGLSTSPYFDRDGNYELKP